MIFGNFQHISSLKKFPLFFDNFRGGKVRFLENFLSFFVDENNMSIVMNTMIEYDIRDYVLSGTFVSCWSYFQPRKVVITDIVGGSGGL